MGSSGNRSGWIGQLLEDLLGLTKKDEYEKKILWRLKSRKKYPTVGISALETSTRNLCEEEYYINENKIPAPVLENGG